MMKLYSQVQYVLNVEQTLLMFLLMAKTCFISFSYHPYVIN